MSYEPLSTDAERAKLQAELAEVHKREWPTPQEHNEAVDRIVKRLQYLTSLAASQRRNENGTGPETSPFLKKT